MLTVTDYGLTTPGHRSLTCLHHPLVLAVAGKLRHREAGVVPSHIQMSPVLKPRLGGSCV